MTTLPVGISWSEVSRWLRCPRRWFTEYYLGYQPAERSPSNAADTGSRIHLAMEGAYGYGLDPVAVLSLVYSAEIEAHPEFEKELRADWQLSVTMVEGWFEEAGEQGWDAKLEVVHTEAEVEVDLPGSGGAVLLRGKLDQVARDASDGLLKFLDWKTSDSFERTEVIEMDGQMKTYALIALLAAGHPVPVAGEPWEPRGPLLVSGGVVNTLRRVKRTRQSRPPYYQHYPFLFSAERLAAHLLLLQQAASEIMNARERLDAAYAAGGALNVVNHLQRTVCRPVEIIKDCSWSCPLSRGLCQLMSADGGWNDALVGSGRYVQGDPYERYGRGGIDAIRAALAEQAG